MSHPLDGPRLKVRRAESQIDALRQAIRAFVWEYQCEIVRAEFNPKTQKYVYRARIERFPPLEWGVWIGEIAHDLRSALDGLVYQLALLNVPTPTRPSEFPIMLRAHSVRIKGAWRHGFDGQEIGGGLYMLGDLSPKHQAVIERLQPYQRGRGGKRNVLYLLREMNNTDKHRLILLAGVRPGAITWGGWGDARPLDMTLRQFRVLKNGAKLGEADPDVIVQPQFIPTIAFWEGCIPVKGLPVRPTLSAICQEVSDILESFGPEFQ